MSTVLLPTALELELPEIKPVFDDSPSPSHSEDESAEANDEGVPSEANGKRSRGKITSTAEKRASHNAVERARRESLNGRFMELAAVLPNMRNAKRPSKSAIVNKSLEFVVSSQNREQALIAENDALRREVNEMRTRLSMAGPLAAPLATAASQLDISRRASHDSSLAQVANSIGDDSSPSLTHSSPHSSSENSPLPALLPALMPVQPVIQPPVDVRASLPDGIPKNLPDYANPAARYAPAMNNTALPYDLSALLWNSLGYGLPLPASPLDVNQHLQHYAFGGMSHLANAFTQSGMPVAAGAPDPSWLFS